MDHMMDRISLSEIHLRMVAIEDICNKLELRINTVLFKIYCGIIHVLDDGSK